MAIVAGGLLPALMLAGYLAINSARLERAQLEQRADDRAREAAAAVERHVIAIQNELVALASSPALQRGEIAAFRDQAVDVARQIGLHLVLHSKDLSQLINTAFPPGKVLNVQTPPPAASAYWELLQSKKPVVSDVFWAPMVKEYVVSVAVPVPSRGDVQFFLAAGVPTKEFASLLATVDIRANQTVTVIDRGSAFVTRSRNHAEYTGTRARKVVPPDLRSVISAVNREGVAYHAFNRRSEQLGWSISTSVPDAVLEAPMMHALTGVTTAGAVSLAGAMALAWFWGGRIAQSAGALGIDRKPTREEFEVLFNSAPHGVMVADDNGRMLLVNAPLVAKFGYERDELIGQKVELLIPERSRAGHVMFRQAYARDPQARAMAAGRDLYARRKDGSEFPIEIGLNPIKSRADRLVMVTVMDVTARKLASERLLATTTERDELRRRFVRAQEQERLRLAHELHDQTGQSLAAAMLEIKDIENSVPEIDRQRFRLLRSELEQVGKILHRVAWELRPASIDELGLATALTTYINEWSAQCGIEADFHCSDSRIDELSQEICTTIYRVVQEALTNVAKHAQHATNVSVVVARADGWLRLTVEDNGGGFDQDESTDSKIGPNGGLGLPGMQERLMLIGAEFEVESSIGVGTTIFARIPL
jgi:PAS domain S-box-containing protein